MADGSKAAGERTREFAVFRLSEALQPEPTGYAGMSAVAADGLAQLRDAGLSEGVEARMLFEVPGFSLAYAWFKSNFPVFRHSHPSDCLYLVVGGELHLGTEVLRKGDGFFVPASAPYSFTAGPEGGELLEFRQEACRDTHIQANNPAFWARALELVGASRPNWASEPRPA
jgi:hypothetical protein